MSTQNLPEEDRPVGLIAGQGRLPILTAQGIRAAGRRVACVALAGQSLPQLPQYCDTFKTVGLVRIGQWKRHLHRWGVTEAIMVGRVRKSRMYDPLSVVRLAPDLTALRLWYGVLRHDKRTDAILGAVADELARGGVRLIDSTTYIPDHLATEGTLTQRRPTASQLADIEFGLPIVNRMGDLDIGQAIAVRDRDVIAVEAIEGTDRMIARTGALCRKGGWTLIKTGKPHQDMRFDVPTIGLHSIKALQAAGAACLAVEAGKVILLDKPELLKAADKASIAIIGVRVA